MHRSFFFPSLFKKLTSEIFWYTVSRYESRFNWLDSSNAWMNEWMEWLTDSRGMPGCHTVCQLVSRLVCVCLVCHICMKNKFISLSSAVYLKRVSSVFSSSFFYRWSQLKLLWTKQKNCCCYAFSAALEVNANIRGRNLWKLLHNDAHKDAKADVEAQYTPDWTRPGRS